MTLPDVELLKVLMAFQDAKNLVKAAETLKISQPAVTQRLQRLQGQVAHPLYAYEGRKKVLTHYGKALYEIAKQNFSQLEIDYQNIERRYATPEQLVLRVGGQKELVGLFSELLKFTGRIDHRQMSEQDAIIGVQNESLDVALSSFVVDSTEMMSRKFFESSSLLIFHQKWIKSFSSIANLKDSPEVLLKTACAIHRNENNFLEKFCRAVKIEPAQLNCKAIYEDWYSILKFVESGEGFAIVPGFIQSSMKEVRQLDIPHSVIPRSVHYAVFQRKLKKIESFKKVLNFSTHDS